MKNILIIGADLSMNSTGFVIRTSEKLVYLADVNMFKYTTAINGITIEELYGRHPHLRDMSMLDDVYMYYNERRPARRKLKKGSKLKKATSSEKANKRFSDSVELGTKFFEEVNNHLKHFEYDEIHIILEDYAIGKKDTDNVAQIAELSHTFKMLFHQAGVPIENFHAIVGSTLKAWVGNGNYQKYDMCVEFIDWEYGKLIEQGEFKGWLKKSLTGLIKEKIKKGKIKDKVIFEVPSPIDDLVDGFFLSEYFLKVVLPELLID